MTIWPIVCSLVGVINAQHEPFISVGYGACYHFDSFNYSMHYENVQMQMVVMTPARWRTMRMQPEQYVMVQYYNDKHAIVYFGGVGYNIGNRIVYSAGAKYYVMKHISTSVVVYQSFMNHVVVGLNVEI